MNAKKHETHKDAWFAAIALAVIIATVLFWLMRERSQNGQYVYEVTNTKKQLVFFGSYHTNAPRDLEFTQIEKDFNTFKPDITYVEGMPQINTDKVSIRKQVAVMSSEDAEKNGESFYALKLAVDKGIDFESPEPPLADEVKFVSSEGFSKEGIFKYYMYRVIDQYYHDTQTQNFNNEKKYIQPYIQEFVTASGWDSRALSQMTQDLYAEMQKHDDTFYAALIVPTKEATGPVSVVNDISQVSSDFRDQYLLEQISQGLKTHNKIFIVYGSGHALRLEPAIRSIVTGQ